MLIAYCCVNVIIIQINFNILPTHIMNMLSAKIMLAELCIKLKSDTIWTRDSKNMRVTCLHYVHLYEPEDRNQIVTHYYRHY